MQSTSRLREHHAFLITDLTREPSVRRLVPGHALFPVFAALISTVPTITPADQGAGPGTTGEAMMPSIAVDPLTGEATTRDGVPFVRHLLSELTNVGLLTPFEGTMVPVNAALRRLRELLADQPEGLKLIMDLDSEIPGLAIDHYWRGAEFGVAAETMRRTLRSD